MGIIEAIEITRDVAASNWHADDEQRQAMAMVADLIDAYDALEPDWAQAWTDDKRRTWRDVVERNPQHANSPFRQDLEAACRQRGLVLTGEEMAETIQLLFIRLQLDEPPVKEIVVDGDRPLPGWVDAQPDESLTDDRIGQAVRLIGIYRLAISTFDEYGGITGHHVETLPAKRELEKLIARLERESALLSGKPVSDAWAELDRVV